jgi:hypothetical protein
MPKTTKPHYNKSKKKVRAKSTNNADKNTPAKKKVNQKVNLKVIILGLIKQITLVKKAKEEFLTNQQKTV